jgi:hypothetical protein
MSGSEETPDFMADGGMAPLSFYARRPLLVHPLIQSARGAVTDKDWQEAERLLGEAVDAAKDLEDAFADAEARASKWKAAYLRAIREHERIVSKMHEALAIMRSCEASGERGANHQKVLEALRESGWKQG